MLAAPRRERWAWVSARCALLESHLAELRVELQAAVDGKTATEVARRRVHHLQAALAIIESRVAALADARSAGFGQA